jgi:peptide/nickel transport system permease protein
MVGYALRRILYLVPVLVGVSLLAYSLIDIAPGDPARIILERHGDPPISQAEVEAFRHELGLDDPFPIRYGRWLSDAITGDLGTSFTTGRAVLPEVWTRFGITMQIAVPAFLLGLAIAMPLGIVAAVRRNRAADHASRVIALMGASMPIFWLAFLLILFFAVWLGVLPVSGRGGWRHAALPVATLGVTAAAGLMRLVRASLLEVLHQDFIRTATARGLPRRTVVLSHGLRNAMLPVLTLAGLRFGHLLGGAVIIETVFAWPGIGKHIVDAIFARDYPTIQGFVLLIGVVFVSINLLVDLSYTWLDPRVRLGQRLRGTGAQ